MPSYRARLIRFLLKHSIGRRFRRAGPSVAELRKIDGLLARTGGSLAVCFTSPAASLATLVKTQFSFR